MTAAGIRRGLAVALAFSAVAAFAEDAIVTDEDALFGDEEVVETVAESAEGTAVKSLLQSESVRVGGTFTGKAAASWKWNDPWDGSFDLAAPDEDKLEPALSALVFFDGRPTEESRFYGSIKTSWPFSEYKSVLTGAEYVPATAFPPADASVSTTSTTLTLPNIEVFELFSDFSYGDALYLRFGKQTINWGVGYFYSPANVMNLERIDPTDPEAQLEGPVALRALYAIPGTQANLWAYAVFDSDEMDLLDTALAAKAELVFGGFELGLGGYYKRYDPIRGMVTAVGSVRDIALFGEGTVQLGTDRTWVTEVSSTLPRFVSTTSADDYDGEVYLKGTVGFNYTNSDAKLTVIGQYLYDGEGYADADREARIAEARDDEAAIKAILALADPDSDVDAVYSAFLKGLILSSGRHYGALTLSKSELFVDDLSASVLALANLSDLSAIVKPTLSYAFFDGLSLSASATFALGFDDGEYVVLNDGRAMSLSLTLTMGTGSF